MQHGVLKLLDYAPLLLRMEMVHHIFTAIGKQERKGTRLGLFDSK